MYRKSEALSNMPSLQLIIYKIHKSIMVGTMIYYNNTITPLEKWYTPDLTSPEWCMDMTG